MTTREEKIQKIEAKFDAELEKLTDEQLEQIAGGTEQEFHDLLAIMEKDPTGKKYDLHADREKNVVAFLRNELGIESNLNANFLDSFLPWRTEKPATYTEIKTGNRLGHSEVVSRAKAHAGIK